MNLFPLPARSGLVTGFVLVLTTAFGKAVKLRDWYAVHPDEMLYWLMEEVGDSGRGRIFLLYCCPPNQAARGFGGAS